MSNFTYTIIDPDGTLRFGSHDDDGNFGAVIREFCGGHFDCVRVNDTQVVLYVHDEGHLIGLPINPVATAFARQILAGTVVMVGSHSPQGVYDGENYSVPKVANQIAKGIASVLTLRPQPADWSMN
jgi:hypothetical protein